MSGSVTVPTPRSDSRVGTITGSLISQKRRRRHKQNKTKYAAKEDSLDKVSGPFVYTIVMNRNGLRSHTAADFVTLDLPRYPAATLVFL